VKYPRHGERGITRRNLLIGGGAGLVAAGGAAFVLRKKIGNKIDQWTTKSSFSATPPLIPHDPVADKAAIYVAQGGTPAQNVDSVLGKLGGIGKVIGVDDLVIIKVSAQWWNTGMTNVAAVKAAIDQILAIPGFKGEVVVFENTHFRRDGGSSDDPSTGLTRAWTHPSAWNVDVPGMDKLIDLQPHYAGLGAPVSFVGLIDGGESSLAGDPWYDPEHVHGIYGGDDRGPIASGDARDGYHWDFGKTFKVPRSWLRDAQTPLTWPRFTSPRSGLVIDFKDGVFRRENGALVADQRPLKFINMTTCNEHGSTGMTGACKSPMGIVDMSAGSLGTHPRVADYVSVHYFGRIPGTPGERAPTWRMAGPLAFFGEQVRKADLYLTVAEWVAVIPSGGYDDREDDMRQHKACAHQMKTVIAGTDPVAIDAWGTRHLLMPHGGRHEEMMDLDNPDSKVSRFLRYFRQTAGKGTLDPALVTVG
jgi:hypothetical protein